MTKNELKDSESIFSRLFKLVTSRAFIKQGIKFAVVGAIGTLVNLSILHILTDAFAILYLISETIAFIVSVINNYILNKIKTFDEDIKQKVVGKGIKFTVICIIALGVNLFVLFILVEYFGIYYLLAELFAICFASLINFIGNRFWVFRHKTVETTASKKQKNNYSVEFVIGCSLLLLGVVDIIVGLEKTDVIYFLLGVPLLGVSIILLIRLIVITFNR